MQINPGKTYEGPSDAEWHMTVLLIDDNHAVCLPNRPGNGNEAPIVIKWVPGLSAQIPMIERIPLNQFADWATRCISE